MTIYSPREYWARLALDFAQSDAAGLAPVLHPGAPAWYNAAIDRLQARAWARALSLCGLAPSSRVLDVGCGTGRWLRRLDQLGFAAFGCDRTPGMLQLIRGAVRPRLVCAEGQRLPFPPGAFDAVTSVTVVQHIPPAEQPAALDELVRALRPGGCLVLIELIAGQGPHVFSHPPEEWVAQGKARGLAPLGWFGQEFLLFDRIFTSTVQGVRHAFRPDASQSMPGGTGPIPSANSPARLSRRVYWAIRWLAVQLSLILEPLAGRLCPSRWATHGVFVFRK